MLTEVTEVEFQKVVLDADAVLVDFWAAHCPPCRAILSSLEAVAAEYAGRCKVAKVDVDAAQEIAQRYGVRAIPTLLVFKKGQVVGQLVGAVSRGKIEEAVRKAL